MGAADEISALWIQRAFCSIHHPLCANASSISLAHSNVNGGRESSENGGQARCSERQGKEIVAETTCRENAEQAGREASSCHSCQRECEPCHGKACAACPEQLCDLHLAIVDSEGSVLMYRLPHPSHALLQSRAATCEHAPLGVCEDDRA